MYIAKINRFQYINKKIVIGFYSDYYLNKIVITYIITYFDAITFIF
nr:MAG TPA: hypothetical protein [Crassvirales sp.]